MSVRGNIRSGKCHWGNSPSGKCLRGTLCRGKVRRGIVRRGTVRILIKPSQNTQSHKFTISLQCLKKEVRDGVHLLHADKHYKLALSFLMFFQYLRKRILMKFIFCMRINMKVSYKLILTFWVYLARPSLSIRNASV